MEQDLEQAIEEAYFRYVIDYHNRSEGSDDLYYSEATFSVLQEFFGDPRVHEHKPFLFRIK